MNYQMIRRIIGWLLLFCAGFLIVPVITGCIYREWSIILWYGVTAAACAVIGLPLALIKPKTTALFTRDGFAVVTFSWLIMSIVGAFPMWLCGEIPSFVDALFESASGFSTTGATILKDVEVISKTTLMWRSFTHWIGGMGVLVFIMSFVSLSGGQNMHIMKAESTGPSVSKLVPRVRTTALILYALYLSLTLLEFLFLLFGDMTPFEALNTAFSTAGTGGFGVRNDSLASFADYTQIVVAVFLLLFSVNFGCYYAFLLGRFKEGFTRELKVFLVMVVTAVTTITLNLRIHMPDACGGIGQTIKHSLFSVASIVSTGGFTTTDFGGWPELSRILILCLMFVGACAGSTGGGIKVSRFQIIVHSVWTQLETMAFPKRVKRVRVGDEIIEEDVVRSVAFYFASFAAVFAISFLFVAVHEPGNDMVADFSSVLSALSNIGPALTKDASIPYFTDYSVPSKIVLIFDMLAGRLELYPVLVLLLPSTWRH